MRCLYIIIILLLVFSQKSQACYEAELFKVYPVGFSGDTIISVDARIYRRNAAFLDDKTTGNIINEFKAEDECDISELGWVIKTYITKYDKSQNIIESMPLDSARFYGQNVEKQLKLLYKRGFDRIMATNKGLELFKPVSISFCDYSNGCKNLISPDNSSVISSGDIDYLITALSNRLNHPLAYLSGAEYHDAFLKTFSSIRKYSSSSFDLVIVDLQIGQIYGDEVMPQISLGDNIESAVYEEPILYHGFGRDLFFVKE